VCMGGARKQFLDVSINHPNLKLSLRSADPRQSLSEVPRIVEALAEEPLEDLGLFEIRSQLSEEFFTYPELQERLKNSLVLGEQVRVVKRTLPLEREYDLETGQEHRQVSMIGVKGKVAEMFDLAGHVHECMVHIRGELDREQQCMVMDAIKQRLGLSVQPRFFSTRQNLEGNVLLEAVCFGQGFE
jgi:hypothetical protein